MSIARMYRTDDDGTLVFREAWVEASDPEDGGADGKGAGSGAGDGAYFVVNHGAVGHQSTSREEHVPTIEAAEGLLAAFIAQCAVDGYAVIDEADQALVVAQFALKSSRITERDRYLEHKAREALTGHLAWRGSGTVERTEFVAGPHGTGKLNIVVRSPDPATAVANIKVCIREAKLDFTKLSIATAPAGDPTALKVRHAPPGAPAFSLGTRAG